MVKKMLILFSVCLNIGFIVIAGYTLLHHKEFSKKRLQPGMRHIRLFEELHLSDEQQSGIDLIVSGYMDKMGKLSGLVRKERINLFKTLEEKGPMDDQKIKNHLKNIQKLEVEREVLKINHLKSIKGRLSDEQAGSFFQRLAMHTNKRYFHKLQTKH